MKLIMLALTVGLFMTGIWIFDLKADMSAAILKAEAVEFRFRMADSRRQTELFICESKASSAEIAKTSAELTSEIYGYTIESCVNSLVYESESAQRLRIALIRVL